MKQVVLMRGLPGSGKSYLAKRLIKNYKNGVIISTDDFFVVNGEYQWSYKFLSEAHKWCQGLFFRELFLSTPYIIVDNTFIKPWETFAYIEACVKHGYEWNIEESRTSWANDPEECFDRCTHNVPLSTIQKMKDDKITLAKMKKEITSKLKLDK